MAVIPARVRKPKDKGKVEVGVQVVERWILARLRNRTFQGLSELNRLIQGLLVELNGRTMCHVGKSRRELFEALDRPALGHYLPMTTNLGSLKKAKVGIDYHVLYQKHHRSVPYTLAGEKVFVWATERTVEVFHKYRRVASHVRSWVQGGYTTVAEHMSPAHQHYAKRSAEHFLRGGKKIGPRTRVASAVPKNHQHPEQGYRTCEGILYLAKKYGDERVEAASGRALAAHLFTYQGVKNILETGLDRLPLEEPALDVPPEKWTTLSERTR